MTKSGSSWMEYGKCAMLSAMYNNKSNLAPWKEFSGRLLCKMLNKMLVHENKDRRFKDTHSPCGHQIFSARTVKVNVLAVCLIVWWSINDSINTDWILFCSRGWAWSCPVDRANSQRNTIKVYDVQAIFRFSYKYLTTALKVAKNLPCSKTFQNIFFMLEYKVTRSPLFLSETVTREVKHGRELKSFAAWNFRQIWRRISLSSWVI